MSQGNKDKFVFHKGSYKSQCAYMLMLIRNKDKKAWLKFKQEFVSIDDEDSFEFFNKLVAFYKNEPYEAPNKEEIQPTQPIVKDKKEEKPEKKVTKKTAKKAAKKTTKKTAKKTAKKAAKKTAKKTAKKVAKKTAKKTAKKVAKKTAKKTTKKTAKKKSSKK